MADTISYILDGDNGPLLRAIEEAEARFRAAAQQIETRKIRLDIDLAPVKKQLADFTKSLQQSPIKIPVQLDDRQARQQVAQLRGQMGLGAGAGGGGGTGGGVGQIGAPQVSGSIGGALAGGLAAGVVAGSVVQRPVSTTTTGGLFTVPPGSNIRDIAANQPPTVRDTIIGPASQTENVGLLAIDPVTKQIITEAEGIKRNAAAAVARARGPLGRGGAIRLEEGERQRLEEANRRRDILSIASELGEQQPLARVAGPVGTGQPFRSFGSRVDRLIQNPYAKAAAGTVAAVGAMGVATFKGYAEGQNQYGESIFSSGNRYEAQLMERDRRWAAAGAVPLVGGTLNSLQEWRTGERAGFVGNLRNYQKMESNQAGLDRRQFSDFASRIETTMIGGNFRDEIGAIRDSAWVEKQRIDSDTRREVNKLRGNADQIMKDNAFDDAGIATAMSNPALLRQQGVNDDKVKLMQSVHLDRTMATDLEAQAARDKETVDLRAAAQEKESRRQRALQFLTMDMGTALLQGQGTGRVDALDSARAQAVNPLLVQLRDAQERKDQDLETRTQTQIDATNAVFDRQRGLQTRGLGQDLAILGAAGDPFEQRRRQIEAVRQQDYESTSDIHQRGLIDARAKAETQLVGREEAQAISQLGAAASAAADRLGGNGLAASLKEFEDQIGAMREQFRDNPAMLKQIDRIEQAGIGQRKFDFATSQVQQALTTAGILSGTQQRRLSNDGREVSAQIEGITSSTQAALTQAGLELRGSENAEQRRRRMDAIRDDAASQFEGVESMWRRGRSAEVVSNYTTMGDMNNDIARDYAANAANAIALGRTQIDETAKQSDIDAAQNANPNAKLEEIMGELLRAIQDWNN